MKRSKSQSPESKPECITKKFKKEEQAYVTKPKLLDLSDDVLLHIFKYLSSFDISTLYVCCKRLKSVCVDRTLWTKFDLRNRNLSINEVDKFTKFLLPTTFSVCIKGIKSNDSNSELELCFLNTVSNKCPQLKELVIESFDICEEKIKITNFPATLQTLSLDNCQVHLCQNNKSFFFQIDNFMPHLTSLILNHCDWFKPHSLMAISKIPNLKVLRLNSCYGLGDCFAYTSIATKCGLRNLEIADFRDTFLGDSEISCINSLEKITEIYLECPKKEAIYQPEELPGNREVVHVQFTPGGEPIFQRRNFALENPIMDGQLLISDRGICNIGITGNLRVLEANGNGIQFAERQDPGYNNPYLQKLVVRNYVRVTDRSLEHIATNMAKIQYVDVTGTSVTENGVLNFKNFRPEVTLISPFDEI